MPTFIEKSCCNGSRPSGIVGPNHTLRPDIVASMLKDRRVARFVVAPDGYGKSSVLYEYAQVIFGFEGTFWIKCSSPCFIRDLDDGSMLAQIRRADPSPALVVFDDVPHLDPDRTEAFCEVMEGLLDGGCEVVASSVPSAAGFCTTQPDRIQLDGTDLEVTDDEVEVERLRGNISAEAASSFTGPRRAPCMMWSDQGEEEILAGIASEEFPGEMQLAVLSIIAIVEGDVDDLSRLMNAGKVAEDVGLLAPSFPYLGIDPASGTFAAMPLDMSKACSTPRFSLDAIASSSIQGDADGFCMELAQILMEKGRCSRACELVLAMAGKEAISRWAEENGWMLLGHGEALSLHAAIVRLNTRRQPLTSLLKAMHAWSRYLLEGREGALRPVRRALKDTGLDWEAYASSAILASRVDDGAERVPIAAKAVAMAAIDEGLRASAASPGRRAMADWILLAGLEDARSSGEVAFLSAWNEALDRLEGCTSEESEDVAGALLIEASWTMEDILGTFSDGAPEDAVEAGIGIGQWREGQESCMHAVSSFVSGYLAKSPDSPLWSWAAFNAARMLAAVLEAAPYDVDAHLPRAAVSNARRMSERLYRQAGSVRSMEAKKARRKVEFELTHPDAFREGADGHASRIAARFSTPTLNLCLFGGLDVWVGQDRQDMRLIKRRNAKIALSLFAMSHGREVSKERVLSVIWPAVSMEASTKNFYVVWGYMKKILSVGGSCPYLIRTQSGYKLDSRYVATDLERFEDLCKGLMFGSDGTIRWEEMFEMVSNDFAEDLLPAVNDNEYIEEMRSRYRTQLVDSLVAASSRLVAERESRGAIWFAREAVRRDNTREDAYIALMEAQIASNQRAAALDTYFDCRHSLSDQLGIDPSPKVVSLYRSVIECEEEF